MELVYGAPPSAGDSLLDQLIELLLALGEIGIREQAEQGVEREAVRARCAEVGQLAPPELGLLCRRRRVEEIADPLMQKIRYLDKLIDELAKGK